MQPTTTLIAAIFPCLFLLACDAPTKKYSQTDTQTELAVTSQLDPVQASAEVMGKWTRSCALCHVNGEGGAPRVGFAQEWKPRLVKGQAVLLKHTIEGFNNMPPLGYCMSCEEEDFVALIDFMPGESE